MNNKNIVFISILIFTICLTGCNNADNINDSQEELEELNVFSYDISSMTYTVEDDDNNISIEYPVVSGLSDEVNQKKINELIKAEALKVYNTYYCEDRDYLGHLNLDIEYTISLENEYILSIQYYGLGNLENAPHPHKLFYTTNIDMMMGNRLRLVDLVNIEEELINMFISGKFEPLCQVQDEFDLGYYGSYDGAEESFINADNMESVFSYLTNDSLGISIPVSHAIGGHAEFEIKYKDITEYLASDSDGWNEFNCFLYTDCSN